MRITRFHIAMMTMICVMSCGAFVEAGLLGSIAKKIFGSSHQSSDYLPLKEDLCWQYEAAFERNGISRPRKDNYVLLIQYTENDESFTPARMLYGLTMENSHRNSMWNRDVFWHNDALYLDSAASIRMDFKSEPGEILFSEPGYRQARNHDMDSESISYLGTEGVTVPAGNYADCRKYKYEYVTYLQERAETVPTLRQQSETYWFARGVGMVKIAIERSIDNGESYTLTYSLVKYGPDERESD